MWQLARSLLRHSNQGNAVIGDAAALLPLAGIAVFGKLPLHTRYINLDDQIRKIFDF